MTEIICHLHITNVVLLDKILRIMCIAKWAEQAEIQFLIFRKLGYAPHKTTVTKQANKVVQSVQASAGW